MKKIGITGGIGSGKTTVCKLFENLNVPVYYADERAKYIINNDLSIKNKIIHLFGEDIYNENGLDRKKLALIVFNNKLKLNQLNNVIHPEINIDFLDWSLDHFESPYILKEAALLFETGSYKQLDKVITVFCPLNLRIQRVLNRDKVTELEVKSRMKNQWNDEVKIRIADFVVTNFDEVSLTTQVLFLHKQLI